MSWKTLKSPGSNQWHPADRKILRFINSAKSSTTKQMVHWWISCLSIPIKKTKWDVDNRHSKECRSFAVDLHCNTFKIRFWVVYTQANGDACRRDRTRNTQPPNADTIDFFFFGPRKRGVRPHPPNPPWLRAWKKRRRSRVDLAQAWRVLPIITHDCGILLEKSLTWDRASQKKKKKKKKKKRTCSLAMPQQPLHWTWSNMKQEWGSFQEQKSLPTNPRKSFHLKWAQRSFARIFLPTMADINFPRTLAQGVCRWVLFQHWTTPFSYTIAKALLYLQKRNYISWLVLNFLKLATTFRKIVFGNWWLFAIHFSSFVLSLSLFFFTFNRGVKSVRALHSLASFCRLLELASFSSQFFSTGTGQKTWPHLSARCTFFVW